jgi:hypothetical protein
MNTLYILDPTNFKGTIVNSMSCIEGVPQYVDFMDTPTTFEEYKKQKGNENLIALSWEDFERDYYDPYIKSLCEPFKPTTKELFWDGLECLPPKRWTQFKDGEFFFVGECTTYDLYSCYVRKGDKYFNALRSITTKAEDIINLKD